VHPLDAVSEPRRREILARLAALGEAPVGVIAETIAISRPAVSQHLKVLKDAGVTERRSGRNACTGSTRTGWVAPGRRSKSS